MFIPKSLMIGWSFVCMSMMSLLLKSYLKVDNFFQITFIGKDSVKLMFYHWDEANQMP